MDSSAALADQIASAGMPAVAQYAVPMAYRIRFNMQINAREAVHLIELRTSEQAHRNYRSIARRMFELIRDEARHAAIAGTMKFIGDDKDGLERLAAEQRNEARRAAQTGSGTRPSPLR